MTEEWPEITSQYVAHRFGVELAPNETPLHAYGRSWIFLARRMAWLSLALIPPLFYIWGLARGSIQSISLPMAIAGAIYLLVVAGIGYYIYRDWYNDALILTDQRLIYVEQVLLFSQRQQEVLLRNVQNVTYNIRGLVARLFNYGQIQIETAARRSDIAFGPIHRPKEAQDKIMEQVRSLRTETSRKLMEETILWRLGLGPEPEVPGLAELEKESPRWSRWSIGELILPNPRVEGDTITWYKHWYFLVGRLFLPTVFLAVLVIVAFFMPTWNAPPLLWLVWTGGVLVTLGVMVVRYQLWKGDIYVVTADSLHDIYRSPWGLFGETRRSTGLERIQNISFTKPSLLANIMDFGDIRIETAGAGDFSFLGLPRPLEVQKEIYRRQEIFRQRQEQRARAELADWLAAYRKVDHRIEEEERREDRGTAK